MPITSCPSCEIAMEVQHFEDVLFDICPTCRGIWLDRGEMQKVIAHVRRQEAESPSTDFSDPSQVGRPPQPRRGSESRRGDESHRGAESRREHESRDDYRRERPYRKRRKRSLWDVIEDIID